MRFLFTIISLLCCIITFAQIPLVVQWQKTFGGTLLERSNSIKITSDGGYIITGFSFSSDGDFIASKGQADAWILKADAAGNKQWMKNYGGSGEDIGQDILQTADGGYIFVGTTNSLDGDVTGCHGYTDVWVVKVNSLVHYNGKNVTEEAMRSLH